MRTVIYPGSFDPVTNGHLDVAHRASKLFDKVVVAVAVNESKTPLFGVEERKRMFAEAARHIANLEVVELPGKEMLVITDGPWKWNKGGRLVRARRCTLEVAVRKVATAIAKMKPSQFIKRQPIKASENWRRQKPESKGLVVLGIPTKKCRPDKELAEIFGVPGDFSKYPLRGFSDDRFGTKFGEATKPDDELLDLCGIIPRSKLNDLRKAKSKSSSSTPLPPPKSTTCMHEATELRDGKKYCLTCESFLGYNYEHPNLFSTNKTRTGKDVGTHAASETDSTLSC